MTENVASLEKEIKKLSLNFRRVASRFLNCNFQDYHDCLKRFLLFIEESPVIYEFIQANNMIRFDIEQVIKGKGFQKKFRLPIRESEEIAFIYQMLNYISDNELDIANISFGYGSSNKIQSHVDNFNDQVVKPLVDYIVTYLGEMKIDMGFDGKSSTQYNIREFRGQLNHAEGQSTVTATQTFNETKTADLKDLTKQFIKELNKDEAIPQDDKEETTEILEAAVQEAESEKPKKIILKTAIEKVKSVGELASAGTALFTLGSQLVESLQGLIA
ncbi:hypothetical protein HMPREF1012_02304 [Bacillus sp. BT1B_CT2]|uniref:hypothetical protein n=1 Tax=Bacillus TaxID=1386 RepID=UPI0001F44644|nr:MULTISPECIES: hypothetical protein [Bacillus]EFV71665.1 hypothetical protein HMPREF1012_02304 [Bacillus sp. BT1B_CT2]MEC3835430.1 hypothetical protein [Bacillus licheniformis]